jgi:integrase
VFAKVKLIGSEANPENQKYIEREIVAKVIEVCPDHKWRLIFGLTRYAGLRCPSEVSRLTWGDVDFDHRALFVYSKKTNKTRRIPIAPELYPLLCAAFADAEEGEEQVVPGVTPESNLRTTGEKFIRYAGLTPWDRLFQNLRLSCATDWANEYPEHEAVAWGGHTAAVAMKHYWQVSEEHFAMATGQTPKQRGHDQGHNRGQTAFDMNCRDESAFPPIGPSRGADKSCQNKTTPDKGRGPSSIRPRGLEPLTSCSGGKRSIH